jgi:hypothetical protein
LISGIGFDLDAVLSARPADHIEVAGGVEVSGENRQQQGVLDYLRERFGRSDEQFAAIRDDLREQRLRLSAIERDVAGIKTDMARLDMRLDRIHDGLDRIERRLELPEEQPA